MDGPPRLFDRQRVRRARTRGGLLARQQGDDVGYLKREVAQLLVERVLDIRRPLEAVLEIGAQGPHLSDALAAVGVVPSRHVRLVLGGPQHGTDDGLVVLGDEELLPFGQNRFDAVLSLMGLHLVNDLPGLLAQVRSSLKPDGLLLAAFPGAGTLAELGWALTQAELEITGGAGARLAPFVDVRDAGALLQRAGFALPMVDLERITVSYAHPFQLLRDLRAMGELGVLAGARPPLSRAALMRAGELYVLRFGDARQRVGASFEILMLTGWKPAASQPKPARRGTGQLDLGQVLPPRAP